MLVKHKNKAKKPFSVTSFGFAVCPDELVLFCSKTKVRSSFQACGPSTFMHIHHGPSIALQILQNAILSCLYGWKTAMSNL